MRRDRTTGEGVVTKVRDHGALKILTVKTADGRLLYVHVDDTPFRHMLAVERGSILGRRVPVVGNSGVSGFASLTRQARWAE
jgi:hypothetical protein